MNDHPPRRSPGRQGPRRLDDLLSQLIDQRGYAHQINADSRQEAWQKAVGEEWQGLTRAGRLLRGTLEVTVANSLIVQELTFRKQELIEALQTEAAEHRIHDLKFRVGSLSSYQ